MTPARLMALEAARLAVESRPTLAEARTLPVIVEPDPSVAELPICQWIPLVEPH